VQLIPQILYIASHATWPHKFDLELDRIFAHAIRQMYHLPPSYPAALIFLPKTDCGLNFKKISDLAQIQKWGMLGRNSALGLASAAVTHSLIKRATENPSSTVLFATSLVEWGSLNRMRLSQTAPGSRSLTNKWEELIEQLMLTEEDIQNSPIGGIFSDGSFTPADVSPISILTHPSQLLQIGHGDIAVVLTPPSANLTTSSTRILHVSVPSEYLQRTTPNTLELSRHVPTHIPAASDCQSVVSSLQDVQGYRR
jgi:hypothetical protein